MRATSLWADFVFGSRTTWPSNEVDAANSGRSENLSELLLSSLSAVGLGIVDYIVEDELSTTIVTRSTVPDSRHSSVSLLYAEQEDLERADDSVIDLLIDAEYEITESLLSEPKRAAETDVLCLLDRSRPLFSALDATKLNALRAVLSNPGDAGIFWAAKSCHMDPDDPS
jgi:hypothetical protein